MEKSYLFTIGLGAEVVALAVSQLFPNAPQWVWQLFLWSGLCLIVLGGFFWVKESFKGLDGEPKPDMTMRDAFKYLMLDSKWSIGKKFNPFDNSGSSRSPNCQLYGQMTDNIEAAAKVGRIKVWTDNNVELEPLRWENLNIDLTTCMGLGDSAVVLDHSVDPVGQLANTMINKRQFLSIWPRANCYQKYKDKELYNFRKMFYQKEYQQRDDG